MPFVRRLFRVDEELGPELPRAAVTTLVGELPDTSLDIASQRTVEIHEGVKKLKLYTGDRRVDEITVSCGVAVFPENGANAEALLRAADEALHHAKAQGSDRIVIRREWT